MMSLCQDHLAAMLIGAAVIISATGCGASSPDAPQSSPKSARTQPAVKKDPLIHRTTLDKMSFPNAFFERKFRRIDAAANAFADASWHHRPYQTFPPSRPSRKDHRFYRSEWATFANEKRRNPVNYNGPREVHIISLNAIAEPATGTPRLKEPIVGLYLSASWKPEREGWGATLYYESYSGQIGPYDREFHESFIILLDQWGQPPISSRFASSGYSLKLAQKGLIAYQKLFYFGEIEEQSVSLENNSTTIQYTGMPAVQYTVKIVVDEPRESNGELPDRELRCLLASPETLRDFAIAQRITLLKQVEPQVRSGEAIVRAEENRMLYYGQDSDDLLSDRPLREKERKMIIDLITIDIMAEIDAINSGYKEMYAAIYRAFPIVECLNPAQYTACGK